MSSVSEKTVIRARVVPATLRVSNWPLRDEPLQSGLVMALTIAFAVAGAAAVQHYAMGLVIAGVLGAAMRKVWLPTVFELGSKGIVHSWLGRKRRVPWTEFARYEVHRRGILLCPDSEPNSFTAWRGLFIPCTQNRDEVVAVVEFYLQGPLQNAILSTRSLTHVAPPSSPVSQ